MRNAKNLRSRRKNQSVSYDTLEKKLPLTSFVVTTGEDIVDSTDGQVSLREALTAANTNEAFSDVAAGEATGDQISFAADVSFVFIDYYHGDNNGGEQIQITDDLIINGDLSGGRARIIGINNFGGNSSTVSVTTSQSVELRNLEFSGGIESSRAISATGGGDLLLENVLFQDLRNYDTVGGSAVYHEAGELTIENSEFRNNYAFGKDETASGGAIYSASGNVTIRDSRFFSNIADRAGGAIQIVDGILDVSDSTFGDREGGGNRVGNSLGNGGAIHVSGKNTRTVINRSTFAGNFAGNQGGALWNQEGSLMLVRNSTFSGNSANGAASDSGGGAIYNEDGGRLFTRNATITGNDANGAAGSGGGIFSAGGRVVLNESTVSDNLAFRAGGGIEVTGGRLQIVASTLAGNIAGSNGNAAPGNGGGLHVTAGDDSTLVVIEDTDVTGNIAYSEGGGLWNAAGATMIVRGDSLIDSNASGSFADEFRPENEGGGGGIYNDGGTLRINAITVSNNLANNEFSAGGGIFSNGGDVLVNNSIVSSNTATSEGGGLAFIGGSAAISNSAIDENLAGVANVKGQGGGMFLAGDASVNARRTQFNTNRAALGGGIATEAGTTLVLRDNSRVQSNTTLFDDGYAAGVLNRGSIDVLDSIFAYQHVNRQCDRRCGWRPVPGYWVQGHDYGFPIRRERLRR